MPAPPPQISTTKTMDPAAPSDCYRTFGEGASGGGGGRKAGAQHTLRLAQLAFFYVPLALDLPLALALLFVPDRCRRALLAPAPPAAAPLATACLRLCGVARGGRCPVLAAAATAPDPAFFRAAARWLLLDALLYLAATAYGAHAGALRGPGVAVFAGLGAVWLAAAGGVATALRAGDRPVPPDGLQAGKRCLAAVAAVAGVACAACLFGRARALAAVFPDADPAAPAPGLDFAALALGCELLAGLGALGAAACVNDARALKAAAGHACLYAAYFAAYALYHRALLAWGAQCVLGAGALACAAVLGVGYATISADTLDDAVWQHIAFVNTLGSPTQFPWLGSY